MSSRRLRGTATPSMQARDIALWATSGCQRVGVLAAAGVNPTSAAETLGDESQGHISRFQAQAGMTHEQAIFGSDCAGLGRLLSAAGLCEPGGLEVQVFGRDPDASAAELASQLHHAHQVLATLPDRPTVVIEPPVALVVAGVDHVVYPDFVFGTNRGWLVGEAKAGLDLAGYTNQSWMMRATTQASVGAAALAGRGVPVSEDEVLVVLRSRFTDPPATLHRQCSTGAIAAVRHALGAADDIATRWWETLGRPVTSDWATLESIPHRYRPECHSRCALAQRCHDEEAGRAHLGAAVDISGVAVDRLIAVACGDEPANPIESSAMAALRSGHDAARVLR